MIHDPITKLPNVYTKKLKDLYISTNILIALNTEAHYKVTGPEIMAADTR